MAEMTVRVARADDAEAMGAVFVAAARAGWSELFPPATLAALRPPARLRHLATGAAPERVTVALEREDAGLVGFAVARACPDADAEEALGEVEMLYTHPSLWGRGAGRTLMAAARAELAARGFHAATHWVAVDLPHPRRLLEGSGWSRDGGTRLARFLGVEVAQERYRVALETPEAPAPAA